MEVKITTMLRDALDGEGGADILIKDFKDWKSGDEYGSYVFGKDGAYTMPVVDGEKNVLRHVHLVPITDRVKLSRWNQAWRRRSRKVSDRALVYINGGKGKYLLIYILDESGAHDIAKMKTAEHKELMEAFAAIAEAFLDNGDVP
jgi:hypothetical protein